MTEVFSSGAIAFVVFVGWFLFLASIIRKEDRRRKAKAKRPLPERHWLDDGTEF